MAHHHGTSVSTVPDTLPRIALVGAPNAGKTSIFNGLTGVHAKTGNYPGVTVSRSVGTFQVGQTRTVVEDLPGTYGLDAISPDEKIVSDVLGGQAKDIGQPDAVIAVVDATTLQRSLRLLAQLLAMHRPVCVAVTLTDELTSRGGHIDIDALGRALGVPAVRVVGNRGIGIPELRQRALDWRSWPTPPIDPPTEPDELSAWVDSILASSDYRPPGHDPTLSHPARTGTLFLIGLVAGSVASLIFWPTAWNSGSPIVLLLWLFVLAKLVVATVLFWFGDTRAIGAGLLVSLIIGFMIFFGVCAANFKI